MLSRGSPCCLFLTFRNINIINVTIDGMSCPEIPGIDHAADAIDPDRIGKIVAASDMTDALFLQSLPDFLPAFFILLLIDRNLLFFEHFCLPSSPEVPGSAG